MTRKEQKKEGRAGQIEKKLDQDMTDLLEYVSWMSGQNAQYKLRVRKAEKVISDLRSSGEDSVDKLMETMYLLKIQVEEKEAEAEHMRVVIRDKEETIMVKEGQKGHLKQQIEINNADRENEIEALRNQLHDQRELMDGQQRLMNELQVLCEFTSNDIIKANKDLNKKKIQKKQINLQYQEIDQSTVSLKNKFGQLAGQMDTMIAQHSPKKPEQKEDQND